MVHLFNTTNEIDFFSIFFLAYYYCSKYTNYRIQIMIFNVETTTTTTKKFKTGYLKKTEYNYIKWKTNYNNGFFLDHLFCDYHDLSYIYILLPIKSGCYYRYFLLLLLLQMESLIWKFIYTEHTHRQTFFLFINSRFDSWFWLWLWWWW